MRYNPILHITLPKLTPIQQDYYVMMLRIRKFIEYGIGYRINLEVKKKITSKSGLGAGLIHLYELDFGNDCIITYGHSKSGTYYFELDFFNYKLIATKLHHGKPQLVSTRDIIFGINYAIFNSKLIDRTSELDEIELDSLLHEFFDDYMGEEAYGERIRDSLLAESLTPAEMQRLTPW